MSAEMVQARLSLTDPNIELATKLRQAVMDLGFDVIFFTKRGLNFCGSRSLFRKVFRQEVVDQRFGPAFKESCTLPESLAVQGVSLYFPSTKLVLDNE